ncbi:hypothetical protein HYZ70_00475 [Candidatus Curtissbacteria bacterium]|nr:hypothetical protein [Candidatus Curtissbacteria bacterium]
MAAEIETLYRKVLAGMEPGDEHWDLLRRHYLELRRDVQLGYLGFESWPKTEKEVREELARQADVHLNNGFNRHPAVRMGRGKFKDSLIAVAASQPERHMDRVDIPVVSLGAQIPREDFCKAAGINYWLEGLSVTNWPDDPKGYRIPEGMHLVWMSDGGENLDRKVEDVREDLRLNLADIARGATGFDGLPLVAVHPRVLEHHFPDLPGG